MTVEQILQTIEDQGISVHEFAYGEFGPPDSFQVPENLAEEVRKLDEEFDRYYEMDWDHRQGIPRPKSSITIKSNAWADSIGIGPWEEIAQKGGMDEGSEWYSVKYFKDHDVYIKTEGYYQSHHGTDFDEGYGKEVFPKQKQITVYE